MKVRLKTLMAGPDGCCGPGIVDLPARIARNLIERRFAEELSVRPAAALPEGEVEPTERSIKPPMEQSIKRGKR